MNMLKRFFETVSEMNSTNTRIFAGISCGVAYVFWIMVASAVEGWTGKDVLPPETILDGLGLFILGLNTLEVTQFGIKRKTHKPEGETVETERVVERTTVEAQP